MAAVKIGDTIDVAGYEYTVIAKAPEGKGTWSCHRVGSNGKSIYAYVGKRKNRWAVVGHPNPSIEAQLAARQAVTTSHGETVPEMPGQMAFDAKAHARRSDPSPSHAGAAAASVNAGTHMHRLLQAFASAPSGATAAGAAAYADLSGTGYWKRVSDLKNAGYIWAGQHEDGTLITAIEGSGVAVTVWFITPEGLAQLEGAAP